MRKIFLFLVFFLVVTGMILNSLPLDSCHWIETSTEYTNYPMHFFKLIVGSSAARRNY